MTTDLTTRNLEAINGIYQAFGTGDLEAFLGYMAPDVDWDYAYPADHVIPWLQHGAGREQAARFMQALGENLEVKGFTLNHVIPGDRVVVVLFSIEGVVRSTGKTLVETDEPHIWWFNDEGKVWKFRHAADTLQHAMALQD